MGLFTREEKTHFERDEEGRVVKVERTRNGQPVSNEEAEMKSSKQLEREYYKEHPQEKHKTARKVISIGKSIDKRIVNYNRRNPPSRVRYVKYSTKNNYNPIGSTFDMGLTPMRKPKMKKPKTKYHVVKGKAYPIAGTGKKKKKKKSSRKTSGGFDIMDNWGFM